MIQHFKQPYDKWDYARHQAAVKLGLNDMDLPDEPDFNTLIDIDKE